MRYEGARTLALTPTASAAALGHIDKQVCRYDARAVAAPARQKRVRHKILET